MTGFVSILRLVACVIMIAIALSVPTIGDAAGPDTGINVNVLNPVTLNPAAPNPVTIVNPAGAPPSTVTVANPVTAADIAKALGIGQPVMFSTGLGNTGVSTKFQVPAAQRLVIEYVSGSCFVGNASIDELAIVVRDAAGHAVASTAVNLSVSSIGSGSQAFAAFGHLARVYANPGTAVTFEVIRSEGGGGSSGSFCDTYFSGQLVAVP